jgi:hypothetical protein
MTVSDVPVVLAVYNRPEKLQRLIEIIAQHRPRLLLVIADGPKAGNAEDALRVSMVRRMLDRIDWPCEVLRRESPVNVGCDTWVPAGIDWAFEHVERAIVLEDDLIVHPQFFAWCAGLLELYGDCSQLGCVSGRNELVRWPAGGSDHVLIHRGSNLGFGTWRRAWQAARSVELPGPDDAIAAQVACGSVDPVVADHFEWLRVLSRAGIHLGWDTRWELQRSVRGMLSAVSATNLVVHGGYDEEATHDWNPEGLQSVQPLLAPVDRRGQVPHVPDHTLDRWSLYVALASVCRDPRMAVRLARSHNLVTDGRTRHHLAPFMSHSDFGGALAHLRAAGCRSPIIERMLDAIGATARAGTDR